MSNLILWGSNTSSKRKSGLRRPKLKKYPKMPKSSSLDVLSNYAKKCEVVKKVNVVKISEYNRKVKARDDIKSKISAIKKSITKMKGR